MNPCPCGWLGAQAATGRSADDPAVAHNLFDGFPQPYTLALAEGQLCRQAILQPAQPQVRQPVSCHSRIGKWR